MLYFANFWDYYLTLSSLKTNAYESNIYIPLKYQEKKGSNDIIWTLKTSQALSLLQLFSFTWFSLINQARGWLFFLHKKRYGRFAFCNFYACDVSRFKLYHCFTERKDKVKLFLSVCYNSQLKSYFFKYCLLLLK